MRIHFEDHGQDFLTWQIDNNGIVVDSVPFQASLWAGVFVPCARRLKPGDLVQYECGGALPSTNVIRYPISAIERMTDREFNARYPVGTLCRYYPVAGVAAHHKTKTRSSASKSGRGGVVVKVDGIKGAVDINHVVMEG